MGMTIIIEWEVLLEDEARNSKALRLMGLIVRRGYRAMLRFIWRDWKVYLTGKALCPSYKHYSDLMLPGSPCLSQYQVNCYTDLIHSNGVNDSQPEKKVGIKGFLLHL
jgi:hypothetical protein